MKNIYIKIALFLFAINFASCSKDDSIIKNESEQKSLNEVKNAMRASIAKDGVLFTYTKNSEYVSGIQTATTNITSEDDVLLKSSTAYTHIINNINVSNGVGLLLQKHFVNTTTNKVVKSLILNTNTFTYNEINQNVPINVTSVSFGCPFGTSTIANCTKLNGSLDYGACMGIAVANYAVNNNIQGACTQYQFINAGVSTNICAGPCN